MTFNGYKFDKYNGMTPKLTLLKLTVESTFLHYMLLCPKLEINFTIKLFLSDNILGKNTIRDLKFLHKNFIITKVNQCPSLT